ncbi:MAG: hypothetical protein AABZ12_03210 [Planctomycetota bacterium]
MSMEIELEAAKPAAEELLAFYAKQQHATTYSREKLRRMLDNTFCMVTARRNGELIGFARGVTDGLWGRLAECKLDPAYQGPACVTRKDGRIEHDSEGIAREMAVRVIEALRAFGAERIDAVAYGTEVDFCEELGFKKLRGVSALELTAVSPAPARGLATSGIAV